MCVSACLHLSFVLHFIILGRVNGKGLSEAGGECSPGQPSSQPRNSVVPVPAARKLSYIKQSELIYIQGILLNHQSIKSVTLCWLVLHWGSSPSARGSALQLPHCCLVALVHADHSTVVSYTVKKKNPADFRQILQLNMPFKIFFLNFCEVAFLFVEGISVCLVFLRCWPSCFRRRAMVEPDQQKTSFKPSSLVPKRNSCVVSGWIMAYVFVCRLDTAGKQYHLWKCWMKDVFFYS